MQLKYQEGVTETDTLHERFLKIMKNFLILCMILPKIMVVSPFIIMRHGTKLYIVFGQILIFLIMEVSPKNVNYIL